MLEYFCLRLDPETITELERVALESGVTKSALVRNSLKILLIPKSEPSLVEKAVVQAKKEKIKG